MTNPKNRYQLIPMTHKDIPEVMAIEKIVQAQPWSKGIFEDCMRVGYLCWVCRENNSELIGYIIQSIAAEEMHILNICIHPNWQRMNLGTLLVQHAEKIGLEQKSHTSYLEVRQSNLAAIRLYKKLGYRKIGLRKNYYPLKNGREDAVIMNKYY